MKPKLQTAVDYFQPDFYHFSQDSIFLARKVSQYLHENGTANKLHCMDLCAGCGVVGLEIASEALLIETMDFIEIQSDFEPCFWQNKELILGNNNSIAIDYHVTAANQLSEKFHNRYDLVVCNPPYFDPASGRLSPDSKKNRCRFFMDSSLQEIMKVALNCLADDGVFFFLSREQLKVCESILREMAGSNYNISHEGNLAETSVFSVSSSSACR